MPKDNFQQLSQIIPNVSHETFADLCAYENLLRQWQPRINLIAASTLSNIWQRHILDSAQIFPFGHGAKSWLDIGSGGGFPALVLACLLKQYNAEKGKKSWINLIESNGKKAAFLRQVIYNLSLPAHLYQGRIENIITSLPLPDIITARALAPLDKLLSFLAPLFTRAGGKNTITALIPKGRDFKEEITLARQHWHFAAEIKASAVSSDSVIILIRHLFPR